ncbi:hypothetical protein JQ543_10775 [Bradyrhizobium diazoefficiens]|nr:hypothetical protein [Bradyrhizobium diazoefficiens]MBR0848223.1 hypothetical protein [Bradyrhizobium diazoefficiens]
MAKDSDPLADAFGDRETGGLFSGFLAEESALDRRMLWRLGTWGVTAVGAVVIAVMANQAQLGWRRDQVASVDLSRQADRLQMLTKESQNEARRLAAAIETLNSDRDRLYARVTVLEQGLDSATGAIARQNGSQPQATAPKPQDAPDAPAAAPSVAPVASLPVASSDKPRATTAKDSVKDPAKEPPSPAPQSAAAASLVAQAPATTSALPMLPLLPSKSIMAATESATSKPVEPDTAEKTPEPAEPLPAPTEIAAVPPRPTDAAESEAPAIAVQQTHFAIDLGSANTIDGLRAIWRGVIKSSPEIATLRPIIMIREASTGSGMQLRLGAGPLVNAAVAATLCAGLAEKYRRCDTTVFDGQRLSMRDGPEKGQAKSQNRMPAKTQERIQENGPEKSQDTAPQAETAPTAKPDKPRKSSSKRSKRDESAPAMAQVATAKPETATSGSTLSSFFRR